jgi:hypothetical protein
MLNKNKYWKTLLGTQAEAFVGAGVAYTTDATYALFVANAAEGEVGFFNAATLALYDGATEIPDGDIVFFAIKRDGLVEKSSEFVKGTSLLTRAAYAAGVAQVSDGVFSGTPVAGKYYRVKVIETTPGYQQYPSWEYGVTALTGETLIALVTRIIALVNSTTSATNKGTDTVVTAAINATDNIRFTANSVGITFRLAFSADALADLGTSFAAVTASSWGTGTGAQIVELEYIGDVMKGVTTQYPLQGASASDFGKPTAFASASGTYNVYLVKTSGEEWSPTPVDKHFHKRTILIAIPSGGTTPETAVKTALGL